MATTIAPQITYTANERVLCYHGPLIYEAKVTKTKMFDESNSVTGATGMHYFVHYKGWKQTWDEWVPASRLLKMTEQNLAMQKSLQASTAQATQSTQGKASAKAHAGGAGAGGGKEGGGGAGGPGGGAGTRGARKDGTRGTKRARDEDEGSKKPEMKLTIPEILRVKLVDDWEAVTKNNQLLTVPRTPSAADVLADFATHIKATKPAHLKEPTLIVQTVVDGLQTYFDRALGNNLLYRFERIQYADMRHRYWTGQNVIVGTEKPMSSIYGAEHLLRMLVSLPQMIAQTNLDTESVQTIRDYSNELMVWMVQEKDRIFQKEYENAGPQYQNLSRS